MPTAKIPISKQKIVKQSSKKTIIIPIMIFLIAAVAAGAFITYNIMSDKAKRLALEKEAKERYEREVAIAEENARLLLEKQEKMWKDAVDFKEKVLAEKGRFDAAVGKFKNIKRSFQGSKYDSMADLEIAGLEKAAKAEKEAIQQVLSELEEKAKPFIDNNDFESAANVYRDYSGVLSEETFEERQKLSEDYSLKAQELIEDETRAQESKKRELFEALAPYIIKGKILCAIDVFNKYQRGNPLQDKAFIADVEKVLSALRDADKFILDSYKQDIGKEVCIEIAEKKEKGKIREVKEGCIYIEQEIGKASVTKKINIQELSLPDKLARIEKMEEVPRSIFAAILAVENGKYDDAEKSLSAAGIYSESLLAQVESVKIKEALVVESKTEKDTSEEHQETQDTTAEKEKISKEKNSIPSKILPRDLMIKVTVTRSSKTIGDYSSDDKVQKIRLKQSVTNKGRLDIENYKIDTYIVGESITESKICCILKTEKKDLNLKAKAKYENVLDVRVEYDKSFSYQYGYTYYGYIAVVRDDAGKIFVIKTTKPKLSKIFEEIKDLPEETGFDLRTGKKIDVKTIF